MTVPSFRRASLFDRLLGEADQTLRVLAGAVGAQRANPAGRNDDTALPSADARHAAGLMRVNHVGEVCAQALYRGQALACRDDATRAVLLEAAAEETDHLAWLAGRLKELNARPSLLNPLWYAGAFAMGLAASRAGKARNLGFMAETERQVEQHLDSHMDKLPQGDTRSRAIVAQMRDDEIRHRQSAERTGAAELPLPLRGAMRLAAKVMTSTAYYI